MKKQSEKVAKEDFIAYREVQFSGVTNMFDVATVSELSNLSREKIIDIMKNYSAYAKQWG
ncbi:MAG: hypothetical protein NTY30_00100 [Candidatus Berkelbacteria bacterium]|nr:hypothetical protein [Candidatus Berkelbacteria bacterium]